MSNVKKYLLKQPKPTEAIQIPSASDELPENFIEDLEDFMGDTEWNSERDGSIGVRMPNGEYIIAEPGDYIYHNSDNEVLTMGKEIFETIFKIAI